MIGVAACSDEFEGNRERWGFYSFSISFQRELKAYPSYFVSVGWTLSKSMDEGWAVRDGDDGPVLSLDRRF